MKHYRVSIFQITKISKKHIYIQNIMDTKKLDPSNKSKIINWYVGKIIVSQTI